ncbi:hypothetical protein L7F22_002366 [Adiantum nelumboides]|nr:hypothetical protein [Adiantum nelumboides]
MALPSPCTGSSTRSDGEALRPPPFPCLLFAPSCSGSRLRNPPLAIYKAQASSQWPPAPHRVLSRLRPLSSHATGVAWARQGCARPPAPLFLLLGCATALCWLHFGYPRLTDVHRAIAGQGRAEPARPSFSSSAPGQAKQGWGSARLPTPFLFHDFPLRVSRHPTARPSPLAALCVSAPHLQTEAGNTRHGLCLLSHGQGWAAFVAPPPSYERSGAALAPWHSPWPPPTAPASTT